MVKMVILFLSFVFLFFLPLYINEPGEWRASVTFSGFIASITTFIIWYRKLSPEYVVNALKQGNAYHFIT